MIPHRHLELLALPGDAPGTAGFRLTGTAKEGKGLCRVWLRRAAPWNRYPDPRFHSNVWDVRAYRRVDSSFTMVEEFSPASLDELVELYDFDAPGEQIAGLKDNGDPVHDTVLGWARRTLGVSAAAPTPKVEAAPPAEAPAEVAPPAEAPAEAAPVAETAPPPPPVADTLSDIDAWDELVELADLASGAHAVVSDGTPNDE